MPISLLYTGTPRERVIQEWRALGFTVQVQPLFSYQKLAFSLPDLETVDFCILSSQRTVRILQSHLPELVHNNIAFYVVGQKTAQELRALGIAIKEVGEKGFLSLREKLPAKQRGIFWGSKELAEPATVYLEQSTLVTHIPVYQQLQNEISVSGRPDAIIATSPNGIEAVYAIEDATDIPLFVLGETSEARAKALGFSLVMRCSTPRLEQFTGLLREYFL